MEPIDLELIRKHIQGQCTDEEKQTVDQLLAASDEFRQSYEKEKLLVIGIGIAERARLKSILSDSKHQKSLKTRYLWYAAAVIPLFIATYFILSRSPSESEVYERYFEVYGVYEFGTERGEKEDSISRAFRNYQQGNYIKALQQFELLIKQTKNKDLNLYKGICLMESSAFAEALDALMEVEANSNYSTISQWYAALCLIQLKRSEEAITILDHLIMVNNGLSEKAQKLRDDLK